MRFKLSSIARTGIALFFCLVVSSAKAQGVHQIFVATTGNSSATGTETQPVNSIESALKLAQATTGASKVEIIIRGGTYYLDKTIEVIQGKTWNSNIPLSIAAYKGEKVIFHGGKTIDNNQIKPVSDPKWLARFQPEVKSKIRQIDLKAFGVDPGVLRPVGFGRPMAPSWMELFLNHEAGIIARWPNKGTVPIDSVLNSGSADTGKTKSNLRQDDGKPGLIAFRPVEDDYSNVVFKPADTSKKAKKPIDTAIHGGKFYYNDPRPSTWKEPKKVWLTGFFNWGYADDAVPLSKIDTIRRILTTALPTKYGFATGKPFRAYYAYNMPEEIDMPGEYYVDSASRVVYFLPPDKLKSVEVSVLEDPMMRIDGVSKVEIKDIEFTCARGMGIDMMQTKDVRIDGCTFSNLGMMAIFMGEKGIETGKDAKPLPLTKTFLKNAVDIVNYVYNHTTYDTKAGTNNGIVNCVVYNTGTGGIYMGGGDRLKLIPGHNFVKNCQIHDYNRIEKTYRPAVYIAGVGNSISNCDIFNAPSVAILLHGNNHVIEYNRIYNTTLEVDDMGAVYYGRDPSERGNTVRYNYFHNIGGQHKTEAIYHDDGACGMTVTGNIFYRAGTVSGFIGGGQDNNYTNNIFLNVRYAFHIDKRLNNWAKGVVADSGLFEKRLKAVNYTQPPYSTAYPTLKDYFAQAPDQPQRNRVYLNLMVNVEELVEGDPTIFYFDPHNYQTDGDPGFKNYANKDFNIRSGSIIYNKLPGFVAPPFDKMGYHKTK